LPARTFACAQYYSIAQIRTKPFKVPVKQGQKLRIKLRLADRGDRLIDSAVYLPFKGLGLYI
jgi:hypothetical protein